MTDEDIKSLFAAMLQVSPEEVRDETRPGALARWDSMQHLIVVSSFEEELGLDLEPEEAAEMYSDFGTFKRIIRAKLEAK